MRIRVPQRRQRCPARSNTQCWRPRPSSPVVVCSGFAARSPIPEVADWHADPTEAIAFLEATAARGDEASASLAALDAPSDVRDDHLANLQTGRDTVALIRHEIDLLRQGKVDEAIAVDAATGPLNQEFQNFEQKYSLGSC